MENNSNLSDISSQLDHHEVHPAITWLLKAYKLHSFLKIFKKSAQSANLLYITGTTNLDNDLFPLRTVLERV